MDVTLKVMLGFQLVVSIFTVLIVFLNTKALREVLDALDRLVEDEEPEPRAKNAEELLLERLGTTIGRNYAGRK